MGDGTVGVGVGVAVLVGVGVWVGVGVTVGVQVGVGVRVGVNVAVGNGVEVGVPRTSGWAPSGAPPMTSRKSTPTTTINALAPLARPTRRSATMVPSGSVHG